MSQSGVRTIVAVALISLVGGACAVRSPAADQGGGSAQAFADLLAKSVSYDYDPFATPQDQYRAADAVVVGRVVDVEAGRELLGIGEHATLHIEVIDILKGERSVTDGKAYVEVPINPVVTVVDLKANAPEGRVVLFLDDRSDLKPQTAEEGRPSRAKIFAPFAQGIVIESGVEYLGGFEDLDEMPASWTSAKSFEEFVSGLTSAPSHN